MNLSRSSIYWKHIIGTLYTEVHELFFPASHENETRNKGNVKN